MTMKEALVAAGVAERVEEDESPSVRVEFTKRSDEDVHLQIAGYELSQERMGIDENSKGRRQG